MIRRSALNLFIALLALLFAATQFSPQPAHAQILGQDWTGTFFSNTSLSGTPIASAYFPEGISCNWTNAVTNCLRNSQPQPISGVGTENYSVTFTSTQTFNQSGTYAFTLRYNDGMRLTLNDEVVYNDFTQQSTPDTSGTCQGLCKEVRIDRDILGDPVKIRVDYVQYTGTALIQVQWGLIAPSNVPLITNGNFERDFELWSVKNGTGDRVKCDTNTKIYAYKGQCAFRFKGVPGENAKLVQNTRNKFYDLGSLTLDGYVNADGAVDSQVKVIVSYPDSGAPSSKLVIDLDSATDGAYVSLSTFTDSPAIVLERSSFKVKVILSNSGESGNVLFDTLKLSNSSNDSRTPTPVQWVVQPLPQP